MFISTYELKQINQFTRRDFKAEELYVFPVALCDNEIDRDGERFTITALEWLTGEAEGNTIAVHGYVRHKHKIAEPERQIEGQLTL